ncbi:hypothetical protein CE122_000380 [Candidatus Sulcia muelleri]|uniref:hypothetical protein n=2 Tax=Candidatus Karelsulcia muelleri TaxID=336810 RepID=UPI000BC8E788|nr:hypothetical protein [Candidatus Karelsulcia muelleri]NHU72428.1 hypothetical protein [Candidatus Karelsulcia muelleri]
MKMMKIKKIVSNFYKDYFLNINWPTLLTIKKNILYIIIIWILFSSIIFFMDKSLFFLLKNILNTDSEINSDSDSESEIF